MSYFIKCSAGEASLKKQYRHKPLSKYELSDRKTYIDYLSSLPDYLNVSQPTLRSTLLGKHMSELAHRDYRENIKENESWEKMLDKVYKNLLSNVVYSEDEPENNALMR